MCDQLCARSEKGMLQSSIHLMILKSPEYKQSVSIAVQGTELARKLHPRTVGAGISKNDNDNSSTSRHPWTRVELNIIVQEYLLVKKMPCSPTICIPAHSAETPILGSKGWAGYLYKALLKNDKLQTLCETV